MFDFSQFETLISPTIVGICLITGALIKHETSMDNKHIPAIVTLEGLILALVNGLVLSPEKFTLELILSGAISGILSVGLHQSFRTWIENMAAKKE